MLYQARFDTPVHSMLFLPTALDSAARTVLVGFGDGVVRALLQCLDAWRVTAAFKPHSGAALLSLTHTPKLPAQHTHAHTANSVVCVEQICVRCVCSDALEGAANHCNSTAA